MVSLLPLADEVSSTHENYQDFPISDYFQPHQFRLSKTAWKTCLNSTTTICNRYASLQTVRFGGDDDHAIMNPACKIAMVTGGTSGAGFAAANEFLANGANRVVITGRHIESGQVAVNRLTNLHGKDKASFFEGDVSSTVEFEKIFREVIYCYQKVDILFNNEESADENDWEKQIDTNVLGVTCGTLLAFKYMGKRSGANGGVVINKASTAGLEPFPLAPTFAATKHAVVSLTRNLGDPKHYNKTGLRVVVLCPGVSSKVCKASMYSRQFIKYKKETVLPLKCLKGPGAENIGKAVVELVRFAPSGTVWTLEGSLLSRIDIPPSNSYLKLKKSFKI